MKKQFQTWAILLLSIPPLSICAQTADTLNLETLTVSATQANANTPVTFSTLRKKELTDRQFGQDLPMILQVAPSVVSTSDAGTGIGYTGLRVRGSDPSRINITIDGVPINDSESQLVYWVNMPDFAASTNTVQIQRGVGTSTNGAGAFGATINLQTNGFNTEKYVRYDGSAGSFGTFRNSLSAGTGLIRNKMAFDIRLSSIASEGYVERAASDLGSAYVSGAYFGKKTTLRLKAFTGSERTYQSWYGLPQQWINVDSLRRKNVAGTETLGAPYENQVDDYKQSHLHFLAAHQFSPHLKANLTLHYTRGKGFYEEYKADQEIKKYFPVFSQNTKTDLVRRLWLDNHFVGAIYSVEYNKNKFNSVFGGASNVYLGKHFGDIIWNKENIQFPNVPFYEGDSDKKDVNFFEKISYDFSKKLSGFADLQVRFVGYDTKGTDRRLRNYDVDTSFLFFNPKLGLTYKYTEGGVLYTTFGVANREPNRNDFLESNKAALKSEKLLNTEIGARRTWKTGILAANAFAMYYKNQLAITGAVNDVGEQIRLNVPKSYRAGIELEAAFEIMRNIRFQGNAAFSQNKILNFEEKIDNWDDGTQKTISHSTTDLALSPNVVTFSELQFKAIDLEKKQFYIALSHKYVGKQYIDNTSNERAQLPAYGFSDMRLQYDFSYKKIKKAYVKLLINNVLNQKFSSNAWAYRFYSENPAGLDVYPSVLADSKKNYYNMIGLFPQAGRNFMLAVGVQF